ncbi:MAG: hypothetical protein IPL39_23905 [Opitutaceae bacterium]|nr:hypothetical protein [Opitutaceae bacterium]
MRAIVAFLSLLPALALCETAKIEVGAPLAGAVASLERIGAVDITGGMEIVGPKGEWPLKGIYWEVPDYDAVLELTGKKEKVGTICFWTKKDFGESKSRREDARCSIKSATFDSEKKTVVVEKAPQK